MNRLFAMAVAIGAFWTVLGVVTVANATPYSLWPAIGLVLGGALVIGCVLGSIEERRLSSK